MTPGSGSPRPYPARSVAVGWSLLAGILVTTPVRPLAVGFTRLDPERTGITFTNHIPESRHLTNQLFLDGSGVAAGDVDADGRPDLFLAGLHGGSTLWLNRGDWHFERAVLPRDLGLSDVDATGCVLADLNGDGAPELLVNTHGQGTRLFWNDGRGRFRAHPVPLNPGRGGHTLAVGDVDGDGWPDVYVTNYRVRALMDMPNARATFRVSRGRTVVATIDGRPTTHPDLANRFVVTPEGGVMEVGEPDVLYRNLGGTNLVPLSWTDGAFVDTEGAPLTEPPYDWGLAAMFRDLDGDGRPELYVANDFITPDRLWRNESEPGRFRLRLAPPGTLRHTPYFSMGLDFGDLDRDGRDDLLVLDMLGRDQHSRLTQVEDTMSGLASAADPMGRPQYGANALFVGRADGTFAEVAHQAGLAAADWAWGVAFLDVDLDGWEDVLVTNGQERAARDADVAEELRRARAARRMSDAEIFAARRKFPRYASANLAFRNRGDLTFEEVGGMWGFGDVGVSHGLALADLDGDGDLDVVVNHFGAAAGVYRNDATAPRISVRLRGQAPNRHGIGARITVEGGPVRQDQEMISGGRYLSGDEPIRTFATGRALSVTVAVRWPSGHRTLRTDVAPGSRLVIDEPAGPPPPSPGAAAAVTPWFTLAGKAETPTAPGSVSQEFSRQPLLPRRLSREGPPVAWWDVDGDGREELVVGAGRDAVVRVHRLDRAGRLGAAEAWPVPRPTPGFIGMAGGLVATFSNWDDAAADGPALSRLLPGALLPVMSAGPDAYGAVAAGDIDRDGRLEVFVGARTRAGEHPAPGRSLLGRIEGGRWQEDERFRSVGDDLGRVTGALVLDLDGDGDQDLVVATEWGPIRVLENDGGGLFSEATHAWGLEGETGWWTGLAAGDFDGDGRIDLAASNRGLNGSWALYGLPLHGAHLPAGADGPSALVLAHAAEPTADGPGWDRLLPVQSLGVLSVALPGLRERFPRHADFAAASLARVLGDRAATARPLEVRELRSCVFLQRDRRLVKHPLPGPAQWTPASGLAVADFDGDGRADLFVSQNDFGDNFGWVRGDAGQGLVLRGLGDGRFEPLDAVRSGIDEPGEQRGVAVADPDGDGRPDVALALADGGLRWWRNGSGRPGLRVRLRGPDGNPRAWGATLRLTGPDGPGPLVVRTTGAGLGSVPGPVDVLTLPGGRPTGIEVRWPDGTRRTSALPPGVRSVEIDPSGTLREIP